MAETPKTMQPERRLRRLVVQPEALVHVATGHDFRAIGNPVPKSAKVVTVTYDAWRHEFSVIISDPSFAVVPEAEMLPIMNGPVFEAIKPHQSEAAKP